MFKRRYGYVYLWMLHDLSKPDGGFLSMKIYRQGDCELFRWKRLSYSFHKEPMGRGIGKPFTPAQKWNHPSPNSPGETVLKKVC